MAGVVLHEGFAGERVLVVLVELERDLWGGGGAVAGLLVRDIRDAVAAAVALGDPVEHAEPLGRGRLDAERERAARVGRDLLGFLLIEQRSFRGARHVEPRALLDADLADEGRLSFAAPLNDLVLPDPALQVVAARRPAGRVLDHVLQESRLRNGGAGQQHRERDQQGKTHRFLRWMGCCGRTLSPKSNSGAPGVTQTG